MKKRSVRVLFACALALAVGCFTAACKEHEHEYTQVVTPPTCTERGYTTYSCACGESYDDNYVEALDHDWGEGEVTEESTCTEAGEETFTCSRCGESKTETAEALGHTPAAAVRENEKAATCEEAGSYVEVVSCSVCEKELSRETKVIAETGHSFTNYVSDGNATCTENGTETAKCDHCDETDTREEEDSATGHTPAAAVRENEKAATCEEAGSYEEVVSCSVCEKELSRETKVITALGHSFTNYVSNNDATCTQDGTETAKCDNGCGETHTREEEDSAKGHTPGEVVCDEAQTCTVCGEELAPAPGHDWDDGEVIIEPGCIFDGTMLYTCSRCEETYRDRIPAEGHTPGAAATCTTAQRCVECGMTLAEALGHSWNAGTVTKEPTCTETGLKLVSCTRCGATKTETVEETGHSFTKYVSDDNATCTADGTETAKCDNGCGETHTRDEADSAKGHELTYTAAVAPTCEAAGTVEYWSCSRCKKNFADEDATKELTDITDPATGHTPGAEATCTTAQTCTVCGAEIAPARNHDWREAWTAGDTTHYHTCSRCEERGEEAEHTYTEKVDDTYLVSAATCKQKAVYYKSCSVCGAKGTETFKSGELAAHTEVTDEAVEATCSHAGLTEGKHCSVCDAVLVEQEVVPMLEHDWGEGKVTKEPTCTETGVMTYTCSHCSETKTEPITAKGHTEVTDPAVAPTCTTAGKTQGSHCSVCGYVLVEQQEIAKLAHTYVGHVCSRCYAIEMVGQANIPVGNTVAVHDPSIIVAYADADGALYPDAGENRQKMYFIFGTQLAAAYSYDMESWLMFTPTFYAEKENEEDPGVVSTDYTKIFKSAAAWPGYTDSDTIKGNLWAPDIIYNEDMGQWCLYYSMSGDSSNFRSSIFMMTSDNLTGPYEFVDFVVFSGFNKGTGAGVDDYKNVTGDQSVPSRYSNSKNAWNNDYGVSCIDPSVLYDGEELWLNYGSWSGGIFLLKLDEATGLRQVGYDYGYKDVTYDATKTDALVYDPYLGVHIAGGWYVSGEGPYIAYMNGYYYLFLSYGFYSPEGGYNMRVFRSKTIDGRYEDMNGNWAVYTDAESNSGINYGGNVSKGEVLMQNYKWSWWTGPASLAQGHNSVLVDGDKAYLVYHIKYDDGTAHHNVEVHELVFNKDGWPLAAPFQKSETDKVITDATTEQLAGSWSVILHTPVDYKNLQVNTDKVITLTSDGKVTGAYTGTWSLKGQYITITIGGTEYKGVVMEQQIEGLAGKNVAYTFTATNASTNTPLWGVKNPEGKSAADSVLNSLVLPGEILASINLPTTGDFGTTISYGSSNESVLSSNGVYTAPMEDTEVTLTVKVTSSGYSTQPKAFTIKVLSEANADALVSSIVPEELATEEFIVAKAAPLAGETVNAVPQINASTGVSLTFRVENISTDWDVIFRAPGKDAIVYLSVLNYQNADTYERSATISEAGAKILTDHGFTADTGNYWRLFLGSLCDNEDNSCIATISYNVDGSIAFYRDGVLMLTYAATTEIGESTVGALSKYMAEQVGSVGLEVILPVEDLIIGYAVDYKPCEHIYGAYDGDTATCIYCGGTKVRVEVGEKTYEAEFVSRANAEKVNNTDKSEGWESWVPVGSKWVSGDFAVQYSWANTRDTDFYHDVALQLQTGGNYFTMNMLNGSGAWGALATAEGVTHQGTVTKNGVETPAPVINDQPVGFSCEGVYTATMIRIGSTLIVRQTIALTSNDVWEAFDTFSGITQDDLYVELTANPYWADDIRVAVGTLTESTQTIETVEVNQRFDSPTAFTTWYEVPVSLSYGQTLTAQGTQEGTVTNNWFTTLWEIRQGFTGRCDAYGWTFNPENEYGTTTKFGTYSVLSKEVDGQSVDTVGWSGYVEVAKNCAYTFTFTWAETDALTVIVVLENETSTYQCVYSLPIIDSTATEFNIHLTAENVTYFTVDSYSITK